MRVIIAFFAVVTTLVMMVLGVINIINSGTMDSSDYILAIIISFLIFIIAIGPQLSNTTNDG